jgi:hypothetical protein
MIGLFCPILLHAVQEYLVLLNDAIPEPISVNTKSRKLGSSASNGAQLFYRPGIKQIKLISFPSPMRPLGSTQGNSGDAEYLYSVQVDEDVVDPFISDVKLLPSFIHIQPNYVYRLHSESTVNDPYYLDHSKVEFDAMNFPQVWHVATGSGSIVAVIDTGVQIDHQEFCDGAITCPDKIVFPRDVVDIPIMAGYARIDGIDYDDYDDEPEDDDGHGTHVAGIVGARFNNKGVVGAAYGVKIMPIRALAKFKDNQTGESVMTGTTLTIKLGVDWAVENGADVINLSLGASFVGTSSDFLMEQSINNAVAQGVLVVVAVGNKSMNFEESQIIPAIFPSVVRVSAVKSDGSRANFSNYGKTLDVAAVGHGVYSSYASKLTNKNYKSEDGTSMAAPFVSALGAIIQSYYRSNNNGERLAPDEIRRLMHVSASKGPWFSEITHGHGVIDAKKSLLLMGANVTDVSLPTQFYGSNGGVGDLVCYPNPLNLREANHTNCKFILDGKSATSTWRLFSRRGEQVAFGQIEQMPLTISWNGKHYNGEMLPSGVYQLILTIQPIDGTPPIVKKHLITLIR